MKVKLPKSLYTLIFAGIVVSTTMNASAVVFVDAVKVTNNAAEILDAARKNPGYDVSEYMRPVIVDATDDNPVYLKPDSDNKTYDAYHPIYVREGQVVMTDGLKLNYLEPDYGAILQVSGKNASMVISNDASLDEDHKAHAGYVNIGGPDGAGTLILKSGGSIHLDKSMTAGYSNESYWPEAQTLFATKNADGTRYNNGDYEKVDYTTTAGQDASRFLGKATIIVDGDADNTAATNRTTLEMGNALFLGHADVTIKNGGLFQSGTYATESEIANSIYGSEASCILGRMTGCTTNVNIESGGEFNVTGSIISGYWGLLEDTTINIKVDGQAEESSACGVTKGTASSLKVSHTLGLGIGNRDQISAVVCNTSLNVSNGGTVEAGQVWLGLQSGRSGNVTATVDIVDKASSLKTNSLSMGQGAKLTNKGIISALDTNKSAALSISSGAKLINSGEIGFEITMTGGELTMVHGAKAADLIATGGTFAVLGDVAFNGNIMLSETGFLFTAGTTIDLQGHDFSFEDGPITIVLNDATPALAMFSQEEEQMLASYGITFKNAGTVTGFENDIEATIATLDSEGQITAIGTYTLKSSDVTVQSIPEPTTATLSLLALAGLCARRRRA